MELMDKARQGTSRCVYNYISLKRRATDDIKIFRNVSYFSFRADRHELTDPHVDCHLHVYPQNVARPFDVL